MVDMRTRTRSSSSDVVDSIALKYRNGNLRGSVTTQHTPIINEELMHDVVTADFKGLCRRGEVINSPMNQLKTVITDEPAYADFDATSYYNVNWRYEGYRLSAEPPLSVLPVLDINVESLVQQASVKAKSRIENTDVNILATLWESGESLNLMVSLLWRVYKIAKAVKRFDLKYLRKEISFKELQDRYMEARYGLRPMYYDARGLIKAISNEPRPERQTFRATARDSDSSTFSGEVEDTQEGLVWTWSGTVKREVVVRAGVLCHLEPTSILDRFGVSDVAEAAWDIIPFSFIVDWFLDVGSLIAAWTPEKGVQELASWVVVTDTTQISNVTHARLSSYWRSGSMTNDTNGVYNSVVVSKSRTPSITLGVLPTINVRLNPLKLLDLGIILNKMRKHQRVPVQS